jgi:pyruvate kinase
LPSIISVLREHGTGGVMIARGDLAVEVGFAALASTQQDILALCKSAHLPVIYATGVMETSMKNRLPARAEMIDLATSKTSSCLMLNK